LVMALVGCSGAPSTIEADAGGSSTSETTAGTRGTSSGGDVTGVVFALEPDLGIPAYECDLFLQDCPAGEKCALWADDGGSTLNASRCVPAVDDPAGVSETCHVLDSPYSGMDDCELGVTCWYVDPETLEGECVPLCIGSESNPSCQDPDRYCLAGPGLPTVCLQSCSPVAQDCSEGHGCYFVVEDWACAPDASGNMGAHGDPCAFVNACDPGLICFDAGAVPSGGACQGAKDCCTEICDLGDPAGDTQCAGAGGGQVCRPWYDEAAPPGYEDVGVCTLPS
jgi:hypothetical protein